MHAVLGESPGPVTVRLEYELEVNRDTGELPLSLLLFEPAEVSPLRARVDGIPISAELKEARPHYLTGALSLGPAFRASDSLLLTLEYEVHGGWTTSGRVFLPLVTLRLEPVDPRPQTFQGSVEIPEGLAVTGSFPTSVLARPRGTEGGTFKVGLQGVPAVMSLRVSQSGKVLWTLERALDALVALVLLGMGVMGWRHLRIQP